SPSLTPTPHRESFPHSNTSVSPFLTPTPHRESFPHSYTSHESFPRPYTSVSPSLTSTPHSKTFSHSYTSQRVLPTLQHIATNVKPLRVDQASSSDLYPIGENCRFYK
ncbi:hypothetical protein Hamer_G031696, partial [Homarus americanus]